LAFAAVKVAPFVGGYVGGSALYRMFAGGSLTVADFEADMTRRGVTIYETIKAELPDEYDALIPPFVASISEAKSRAEAQAQGYALTSGLRKKHASALLGARDEALHAVISSQLAVAEMVHRREPIETCNQYMTQGGIALTNPGPEYEKALDAAGTSLVRAIGSGRRDALPAEPASEEDWAAVVAEFMDLGGVEADIAAVGNMDIQSARLCPATLLFLKALLQVPNPAGRRVRADFAYNSASSG